MENLKKRTTRLLELLNHDEVPLGVVYSDVKPEGGFGAKASELYTRDREIAGKIDWLKAFVDFSCVLGKVWLARKKRKPAWISHEECGCMGGGYYCGLYRPYLEANVLYVSTGIPGTPIEGEHYLPSPESMRAFMEAVEPPLPTGKYCVIKPLELFTPDEQPLVTVFFARPEVLSGLHSLACFAAADHNAVVSPFSSACGSIVAWPLRYQDDGAERAVLGGFDLSARKFFKTDELSFAITLPLYRKMLDAMEESALTRYTWRGVRKKVDRSAETWGKGAKE